MTAAHHAYPDADAQAGEMDIRLGGARPVNLAWSHLHPDAAVVRPWRTVEVIALLDRVLALGRAPLAEQHRSLLDIVRTDGLAPMCVEHQLPLLHTEALGGERACRAPTSGPHAVVGVELTVATAELFAELDRVAAAARRRKPVTPSATTDRLHELTRRVTGWTAPQRVLTPGQARTFAAKAMTALFAATGLRLGMRWADRRRPETTMEADTVWAVLAAALAVRLVRSVGPEGLYACASCGDSVQPMRSPRPGEAVYCRLPECQRERRRRNVARHRQAASPGAVDVVWPDPTGPEP